MKTMSEPKKSRKRGRPEVAQPKRNVLSIRGSEEWRDWLHEAADHFGMPPTAFIVYVLKQYSQSNGFEKPMPKR
jgi:hypothetical protein